MSNLLKTIVSSLIGLALGLLVCEIVLRFYNPLPSRVRGNKIQLKTNYKKKFIIEPRIKGLDSLVNYSVNSLGFRGDEKPGNFDQLFSIITVGGSTTECSMLSDDQTWPALVNKKLKTLYTNIWLNNAGIDGCSTYGHTILMEDYVLKLKPKMIVFLIGINDRGKFDFSRETGFLLDRKETFLSTLVKKSELANLINTLYISYKTKKVHIGHDSDDSGFAHLKFTAQEKAIYEKKYFDDQPAFKSRVNKLINMCSDHHIIPVLITQPLLSYPLGNEIMDIYDSTIQHLCSEQNILCIDLNHELERDSMYFYDSMHYTIKGNKRVAELITKHLTEYLEPNKIAFHLNIPK